MTLPFPSTLTAAFLLAAVGIGTMPAINAANAPQDWQTPAAEANIRPAPTGGANLNDDDAAQAAANLLTLKRERSIRLPKSDGHYKHTQFYVEENPDADYVHASEAAYEAFRDIKFSIRIHWGVYSMKHIEASWPFLRMSHAEKQKYQNLYKEFNPVDFNADKWMNFFKRSGIEAFAFTTKHHDGFSMFHTNTRVKRRANYSTNPATIEDCDIAYGIQDTPFKRDIVKELCNAARKNNIKINLYFSHPDWYDADFRPYNYHPLTTAYYQKYNGDFGMTNGTRTNRVFPELNSEEKTRLVARHREQLKELLTNYGKIDMICFDQWMGRDIWPGMRETLKQLRKIQPDVMLRARGIGNYGDYYQPEQTVPGGMEKTNMPWMSICLLGKIFSYDPNGKNYKGTHWIVWNLIDCVAKGGSFMVCVGPDKKGNFHPEAIKQIEATGDWLKVNGVGIYGTRAREVWREDTGAEKNVHVRFTRTKDGKNEFAFMRKWPGKELVLRTVTPLAHSEVKMLGVATPLKWVALSGGGVKITITDNLQAIENRPSKHAWGFEFVTK